MPPGGDSLRSTWFRSNRPRLLQPSCYSNHLGTDTERGEAELRRHTCNLDIGGIRPRAAIAASFLLLFLAQRSCLMTIVGSHLKDYRRVLVSVHRSGCTAQKASGAWTGVLLSTVVRSTPAHHHISKCTARHTIGSLGQIFTSLPLLLYL